MEGYEHNEYKSLRTGLMSDRQQQSSSSTTKDEGHGQTFNVEFPMPEPPMPNYSSAIYASSSSPFNQQPVETSFRRHGYITTKSGLVFRSADSTERALRELEMKRRETRTKRRAGLMVASLFMLSLVMLTMTKKQDDALMRTTSLESLSDEERPSPLDKQISELQINEAEDPAEEEIIEDGKEFLAPFRYFADTTTSRRESDSNFFFHIPRSGGSAIKEIAGKCLEKVIASEIGVGEGHDADVALQVVEVQGANYVNVDTTSIDGLHRAANFGLAESGLADLITSSYFGDVGMLFELEHKGRAFTILRHPLERAVSHYWSATRGDRAYIDPSVTLEDYASGNGIENNWMCRFLTGSMEGEITKEHLEQAKEILKRKFLVGFLDDGEETIYRIMKYFKWEFDEDEEKRMQQEECIVDHMKEKTNPSEVEYEIPVRGSQAFALIKWQTQFDVKLYEYARQLFDEQTKIFGSKVRKKLIRKQKKEKQKKEDAKLKGNK